jgi:hypothetical protein
LNEFLGNNKWAMLMRPIHGMNWERHERSCLTTYSLLLYLQPTPSYAPPKSGSSFCRILYIFVTSALAGGEWSDSCPGRFTPGERSSCTHWAGRWVHPRASLDDVEKRKFLTLPGLELWPLGGPARS